MASRTRNENIQVDRFQVIKDLLATAKPTDKGVTYERIVRVMKNHVKQERLALVN